MLTNTDNIMKYVEAHDTIDNETLLNLAEVSLEAVYPSIKRNLPKECDACGKAFTAPRSDTKFCSAACKQKAYRARQAGRQAQ